MKLGAAQQLGSGQLISAQLNSTQPVTASQRITKRMFDVFACLFVFTHLRTCLPEGATVKSG